MRRRIAVVVGIIGVLALLTGLALQRVQSVVGRDDGSSGRGSAEERAGAGGDGLSLLAINARASELVRRTQRLSTTATAGAAASAAGEADLDEADADEADADEADAGEGDADEGDELREVTLDGQDEGDNSGSGRGRGRGRGRGGDR